MSLQDNKLKIQALLEGILALPEAGSGGESGGLPNGVSAIATGTFTPTSDIKANHTIAHNMNAKPNFAVLILCDDAKTALLTEIIVFVIQVYKPVMSSNGTITEMRCASIYMNSSGAITQMNYSATNDTFGSASNVVFYVSGSTPGLKAGYTYRWICGVLDGIA